MIPHSQSSCFHFYRLLTPPGTPLVPSSDGGESKPASAAPRGSSLGRSASTTKASRVSLYVSVFIMSLELWNSYISISMVFRVETYFSMKTFSIPSSITIHIFFKFTVIIILGYCCPISLLLKCVVGPLSYKLDRWLSRISVSQACNAHKLPCQVVVLIK